MQVKLSELNALVAATREKKPAASDVGLCDEWELGDSGWQPRHDYTGDIGAAWR